MITQLVLLNACVLEPVCCLFRRWRSGWDRDPWGACSSAGLWVLSGWVLEGNHGFHVAVCQRGARRARQGGGWVWQVPAEPQLLGFPSVPCTLPCLLPSLRQSLARSWLFKNWEVGAAIAETSQVGWDESRRRERFEDEKRLCVFPGLPRMAPQPSRHLRCHLCPAVPLLLMCPMQAGVCWGR